MKYLAILLSLFATVASATVTTINTNTPTTSTVAAMISGGTAATISGTIPISQVNTLQSALSAKQDASAAATLSGTQTLTNKTLTSPAISSPTGLVKADVGLSNVDNTSDANKPISTAAQTALGLKADAASLATVATTGSYSSLLGLPVFATVATSGSYSDLLGLPTIPTNNNQLTNGAGYITASGSSAYATTSGSAGAAGSLTGAGNIVSHNVSEFATSAQGTKADSAVQPGQLSTVATTGSYYSLLGLPTLGTAAAQATTAFDASGAASTAQAYAIQRGNHTGTQAASTISDFSSAALGAVTWSTISGKPSLATVATTGSYADLLGLPTIPTTLPATGGTAATISDTIAISQVNTLQTALDSKATSAQGAKADSALQSGSSTVAGVTVTSSNGVLLVSGTPSVINAAVQTALDSKATSAQGAKADSALQSGSSTVAGVTVTSSNGVLLVSGTPSVINAAVQTALDSKASVRLIQTGDFSATVNGRYTVSGTATVTDPTGTQAGQIYSVVIGDNSLVTLGSAQYASSRVELVREYNGSSWVTLPPRFSDSLILNGTQNTANNQTLAGGTGSLLNQGLADARYAGQGAPGTIYESMLAADTAYIVGTTTPQNTSLTLSLPVGTYHFRLSMTSKGPDYATGGVKAQLAVTGSYAWSVSYQMAGTQANTTMGGSGSVGAICNGSYPGSLTFTILNSAGVNGWTCVEGRLVVTTPVVITAQIAQYAASGSTGVCIQAGAYLQAIKQ